MNIYIERRIEKEKETDRKTEDIPFGLIDIIFNFPRYIYIRHQIVSAEQNESYSRDKRTDECPQIIVDHDGVVHVIDDDVGLYATRVRRFRPERSRRRAEPNREFSWARRVSRHRF